MVHAAGQAQVRMLDDFEDLSLWKPIPSEGVKMKLEKAAGVRGNALSISFDFQSGGGYAIAQRRLPLDLPPDYKFTFFLRGETPVNNFEFKLLDSAGNVYWLKQQNILYPAVWSRRAIHRRQINFAWGPAGGSMPGHVENIEFVVSAGSGGSGKISIDELRLEPIRDIAQSVPEIRWSSAQSWAEPRFGLGGGALTEWRTVGHGREWLMIDFRQQREIGGLVIDWSKNDYPAAYDVQVSDDAQGWSTAYAVVNGKGGHDFMPLQGVETRYLRLALKSNPSGKGYTMGRMEVKGPEFSASLNTFFGAIAQNALSGSYPKYFTGRQSFWTVIGVAGDTKEALINEEGAIEVDKGAFSLEPFIFVENRLLTWSDARTTPSLDKGYLPIPSVTWEAADLRLMIRPFAAGLPGESVLLATYRLENRSAKPRKGSFFIALRPFQVNPPWQNLDMEGGIAPIASLRYEGSTVSVGGAKDVIPLSRPDGVGVAEFDEGDITEFLRAGTLPEATRANDHFGFASGALRYDFNLEPGASRDILLAVPFHGRAGILRANMDPAEARSVVGGMLETTRTFWEEKLNSVSMTLPLSAMPVFDTFRSNLAYILINRDGAAIQPGSRTYDRSWIRDGSLTSASLLRTGNTSEVREFLDWYAKFQYPSGKIPCVVDVRGADPLPEHDSHGQFIYAVMQYFLFTHDTTWLAGKFQHVAGAVRYMQSLRAERKTEIYRTGTPEQRACYGLVPESISHEGYSSKPMHSYWDDFFVLRGLRDAASIAGILGRKGLELEYAAEEADMKTCLNASLRQAMVNKSIDFLPGCVELGDFDATSTAIAVNPLGEAGDMPAAPLAAVFEKYYQFFAGRARGDMQWKNYTPYEVRIIGTLVCLGQKQRAKELLDYFLADRRPKAWNHWAEVVWHDPGAPGFIGDMPHTWVGSDFLRSVRTMFVYERESDNALVLGAGIPEAWVTDSAGVAINGFPTTFGKVSMRMKAQGDSVVAEISGDLTIPQGKIVVRSPLDRPAGEVRVDGLHVSPGSEAVIGAVPARVVFRYSQGETQ